MFSNAFLATFSMILVTSCTMSQNRSDPEDQSEKSAGLSYLALGDSYTIGESVPQAERWPVVLARKASENGVQILEPTIIATTGWTTSELIGEIDNADIAGNTYDLVSLLIGVNNQYRGYEIDIFRSEFEQLLKLSITFAKGDPENVFIVSIPDYGVTPFASGKNREKIYEEIDAYNAIKEEVAGKYGITYLNITDISREAAQDPSLVASDSLHPSGKMYSRWVNEIIYPWLQEKLQE